MNIVLSQNQLYTKIGRLFQYRGLRLTLYALSCSILFTFLHFYDFISPNLSGGVGELVFRFYVPHLGGN